MSKHPRTPTTHYNDPSVCARLIHTRRERKPGKLFTDVLDDDDEKTPTSVQKTVITKLPAGEIVKIEKLADGTWKIVQEVSTPDNDDWKEI